MTAEQAAEYRMLRVRFTSSTMLQTDAGSTAIRLPLIRVLPRQGYHVFSKRYPIVDARSLGKVLRLEAEPADSRRIWQLGPSSEGGRTVTFWHVSAAGDPEPGLFELPECLAIASAFPSTIVEVSRSGLTYFCVLHEGRFASAVRNSVVTDAQRFCMAAGFGSGLDVRSINADQIGEAVERGARRAIRTSPQRFVSPFLGSARFRSAIQRSAVAALVVVATYAVLLSGYLAWQVEREAAQLAQLEEQRSSLRDMETRLRQVNQTTEAIRQASNAFVPVPALWDLVHSLRQQSVDLVSIEYVDQKLQLRGSADQATRVLAFLGDLPVVTDARFESPVVRRRNAESFHVSLSLASGGEAR